MTTITLEYIGKSPVWIDNAYGSGIAFEKGNIYKLPHNIAVKLLRHSDCFQETIGGTTSSGEYDDSAIKQRLSAVEEVNQSQTNSIQSLRQDLSSNADGDTALSGRVNELENAQTTAPPYKLIKWGVSDLNIEIPAVSEDLDNTQLPKLLYTVPNDLKETYKVTGMLAYEVFDKNNKRINYMVVCQFTGQNSTELSVRGMVAGTVRKTANKISAYVLLEKRQFQAA